MSLGETIKRFRNKNNLTQTDFGKKIGVNKQIVSKWEKGTVIPSVANIYKIANYIGIEINDLVGEGICDNTNEVLMYSKRMEYNIGLNVLYDRTQDFKTFYYFVDAITNAHNLLSPKDSNIGYLLLNTTIKDANSHEEAISINSIYLNNNTIYFEVIDGEQIGQLPLHENNISYIEPVSFFNNEAYCFNVHLKNISVKFIQIILMLEELE